MNNNDFQRQAAERSRQADEARRRQGIEDFNRHQREQQARTAETIRKAQSKRAGEMGAMPLGQVDLPSYLGGLQNHNAREARKRANATQFGGTSAGIATGYSKPSAGYAGGSAGSSGTAGSSGAGGLGKAFAFLCVVGAIWFFVANDKSAPSPSPAPASQSFDVAPLQETTAPAPAPTANDQPTEPIVVPAAQPTPDTNQQLAALVASTPSYPTAASAPATPETTAPASAPPPPPDIPVGWPAEGRAYTAERKGADNGCKNGTLSLRASSISFACPADPTKSFSATIDQVKRVDDDGIELNRKGKFHFKIDGRDKAEIHQLFLNWLYQPRSNQTGAAN